VIRVGDRTIGHGQPCFIVGEAGVNHNGDVELARRLIDACVAASVDAVKFQTFIADALVVPGTPKAEYQIETTFTEESQLEMLRRLELSQAAYRGLMAECRGLGILFMSTPFDEDSADCLADLGVEIFKIGSGELTNLGFLSHVARKGRPVIVSTGMASLSEVKTALDTIQKAGNREVVLLHCVSAYPAAPADANLRAMQTMAAAFGVPVGYSDHHLGIEVALAAVALGACVIEKHVTLDRNLPGPDHRASLEPDELAGLVRGIRSVESALGHGRKEPAASEVATAAVVRRSLVAACDIRAGSRLTTEMVAVRRPGSGLPPAMRERVVGLVAKQDIPAGALLRIEMLA